MKKIQRSFAVEYKSGRRKTDSKSNSMWGNVDLKSIARDMEEEATSFLSVGPQEQEAVGEVPLPAAQPAGPLLTLLHGQERTASALKETMMVDETDSMTNTDAPAVVEAELAPKKRKPRAKKTTPETVLVEVTAEHAAASSVAAGSQKRGLKAKSGEAASSAKRAPAKRKTTSAQTVTMALTAADDEMADLLQLEQENQSLRRLLAEQLRAENADLRKRLKLD